MKSHTVTRTLVLIMVLGFIPASYGQKSAGSATVADIQQETVDLLQALKGYGVDRRDQAVQKVSESLDNLDARIETLEARIDSNWEQMDKAARDKARNSLGALRRQRTQLAEWFGGWKNSSASAWEETKTGFSKAYRALSDAWLKATTEHNLEK